MAEYSGKDKRLQYLFDAVENVQVDDMTGASASTDGAHGLVPAPLAGDEDKYLKGDGTWATVQAGAGSLSGLTDVDLSSPTDGQALVYDGTNSKWINGNVSGGGGGSARYKEVVLWENANGLEFYPASIQTVALSQSILDFDIIVVEVSTKSAPKYRGTSVIPVSTIDKTGTNNFGNSVIVNTVYCTPAMFYVDDTHIQFVGASSSAADHMMAYKVIGIKWDTMQTALIYSTEEREVGVWIDEKPLYQKTFDLGSDVAISYNTLTNTTINASNMQTIVNAWGLYSTGVTKYSLMANISNNVIRLQTDRNGADASVRYVILQYTKTTDTAGSGTWTTTGEYAHHYSTTEKVIGTWIDGKPVYEITYELATPLTISGVSYIHSGITPTNIKSLIGMPEAIDTYGQSAPIMAGLYSSGELALAAVNNQYSIVLKYLIIRYTKTTD